MGLMTWHVDITLSSALLRAPPHVPRCSVRATLLRVRRASSCAPRCFVLVRAAFLCVRRVPLCAPRSSVRAALLCARRAPPRAPRCSVRAALLYARRASKSRRRMKYRPLFYYRIAISPPLATRSTLFD